MIPICLRGVSGICLAAALLLSCGGSGDQSSSAIPGDMNPEEIFTDADSPDSYPLRTFHSSLSDTQLIFTPWGYDRTSNADRLYPVVVCGCWSEIGNFKEETRKRYPSFYVDFDNYSNESDGEILSDLIDNLRAKGYRIDTDRIYLTGFSQGGSGSFRIARGMLKKGKLFAAIIRQAGQSETTLDTAAVGKSSLWYHVGLLDTAERIDVARQTYANLKNHSSNIHAIETTETDTKTSYTRTTRTLTLNGIEIVKYSEYPDVGHWSPCYNDSDIFVWLFNQSLKRR